ncbi:MAG: hypothetical protein FJX02_09725 [Alphaproteobacteria bacterium]|nr:hypothetical protein [Alphaproteobacteria bacterium]
MKPLLEILARLPARAWLQGVGALLAVVVLAVVGFAALAGVALVGLVLVLGIKARRWLASLFGVAPPPPPSAAEPARPRVGRGPVSDVEFEMVDKKDSPPR